MMIATHLDEYIERVLTDWECVGLAVSVVKGTETIYARGFGARQNGRPERVDADTLFQVGSTTKAMTAAALGILADEGRLHWDAPIHARLADFQLHDPWLTRQVTARDIASHRVGIADNLLPFLSVMGARQALEQLRYIVPGAPFRDSFVYSNLLYALIGRIVEAASGLTWSEFVKLHLLQPLGMSRSGTSPFDYWSRQYVAPAFLGSALASHCSIEAANTANVAIPHGTDAQGRPIGLCWQSYDSTAPAGSVISSAADMARWMIVNLNEGRFQDRQLIERGTLQELHAAHNLRAGPAQRPFDAGRMSYAMGWGRTRYRGHVCLGHGGGMLGFPAYVALLPDERIGVTVLVNSASAGGALLHKSVVCEVFDRLLGLAPGNWHDEFLGHARKQQHAARDDRIRLKQGRIANTQPARAVECYVGRYEGSAPSSGCVELCLENGSLTLRYDGEGAYSAALEHWHHDVFRLLSSVGAEEALGTQFVQFSLGPDGQVGLLTAFGTNFHRSGEVPTASISRRR